MVYGSITTYFDDQNLVADHYCDLVRTTHWERNWLVIFNISKTEPVMSLHHTGNLSPITINLGNLNESPCLERLLGLKLKSGLKWNPYI